MNGSSAMTGVKQIRTSVMMLGRVHMPAGYPSVLTTFLLMALRVSNTPSPGQRHRLEVGRPLDPLAVLLAHQELALVVGIGQRPLAGRVVHRPAGIERRLELGDRRGVGQVALVVLDGERESG